MELFGLLFAAPVTLISSAAYTALAIWAFARWPILKRVALPVSCIVMFALLLEILLLVVLGPKDTYARLHYVYTALHISVLLFSPPTIANLVLHFAVKKEKPRRFQFLASTACCWIACMSALIGNILIDEATAGIDAAQPFYMSKGTAP